MQAKYRKKHSLPTADFEVPLGILNGVRKFSIDAGALRDQTSRDFEHPPGLQAWSNYENLPKLPVPPLEQTLEKLLEHAKPLLSPEELNDFQKMVKSFGKTEGLGRHLQRKLEERAETCDNWLHEWWLKKHYLACEDPLPVNVSPVIMFPPALFQPGPESQLCFAAKLIRLALEYRDVVFDRKLPIATVGNATMDMCQHDWLFGPCRIPGKSQDGLKQPDLLSRHVVVARNGHFFTLDVQRKDGTKIPEVQLLKSLQAIVQQTSIISECPVGYYTGMRRSKWADAYESLIGNPQNIHSLQTLQDSLFLLCLDNPNPKTNGGDIESWAALGHQLMHGNGVGGNSMNRWYDKTLQFIVGQEGGAGILYEHSPMEGIPVAALMDFVMENLSKVEACDNDPGSPVNPTRLPFKLSDEDSLKLMKAAQKADKIAHDLELEVCTFSQFGKNIPKSHGMSPDSFIQIAIQFAFYRCHGKHVAQYETGSLRQFKLGRTAIIRLPTEESVKFAENISRLDDLTSKEEGVQLLKDAVNSHKQNAITACSGKGCDRHLLGFKLIAQQCKIPIPELLECQSYKRLSYFQLSTSQIPCTQDLLMMFGPAVPDGYGICYNPQETKIHIAVTAFNKCPTTSAKKYMEALSKSLVDLKTLMSA